MSGRPISKVLTPGERLRAEILRLGVDQGKLAELTNVSRQTINNIVNDRYPISRGMAARLALITGQKMQYWLQDEFIEPAAEQAQAPLHAYPTAGLAYSRPPPEFPKTRTKRAPDLREMLRNLLYSYAQPEPGKHRASASIDRIGIKFVAETEEVARDSAVAAALAGLREFARANPELMEEEQVLGYRAFVADIGAKLMLDAHQARELVRLLGLPFVDDGDTVLLHNGRLKILALPQGAAQIELRTLAGQVAEPLAKMIAVMAQDRQ
jgi:addiction module HigA family antidote